MNSLFTINTKDYGGGLLAFDSLDSIVETINYILDNLSDLEYDEVVENLYIGHDDLYYWVVDFMVVCAYLYYHDGFYDNRRDVRYKYIMRYSTASSMPVRLNSVRIEHEEFDVQELHATLVRLANHELGIED